MAAELNHAGNIVDCIQVLTLLANKNFFSALELQAGFTAKILNIVKIFTISFVSALYINSIPLIISWKCSMSLSYKTAAKQDFDEMKLLWISLIHKSYVSLKVSSFCMLQFVPIVKSFHRFIADTIVPLLIFKTS